MKIEILPPARFDLIDGYWFYEEQETGLGDYFIESIFADIESLRVYAGIHSKLYGKYRMVASRFPLSIFLPYRRVRNSYLRRSRRSS